MKVPTIADAYQHLEEDPKYKYFDTVVKRMDALFPTDEARLSLWNSFAQWQGVKLTNDCYHRTLHLISYLANKFPERRSSLYTEIETHFDNILYRDDEIPTTVFFVHLAVSFPEQRSQLATYVKENFWKIVQCGPANNLPVSTALANINYLVREFPKRDIKQDIFDHIANDLPQLLGHPGDRIAMPMSYHLRGLAETFPDAHTELRSLFEGSVDISSLDEILQSAAKQRDFIASGIRHTLHSPPRDAAPSANSASECGPDTVAIIRV